MTSREPLRREARKLLPGLMADRARRYERGVRERAGLPDLARRLADGSAVLPVRGGPFAGLRYPVDR